MGANETSFKPGNSGGGRPKGVLNKKTAIAKRIGLHMSEGKVWVEGEGFTKFIEALEELEGKDYVIGYLSLLEYFKPKKARQEEPSDVKVPSIRVFGKQISGGKIPASKEVQAQAQRMIDLQAQQDDQMELPDHDEVEDINTFQEGKYEDADEIKE